MFASCAFLGIPGLRSHPGESFQAKISRSAALLEAGTRRMRIEIDVPNPEGRFIPGMLAKVSLPLALSTDTVTLPSRAVRIADGNSHVLAVLKGVVVRRPVTIISDDGATVVVSGELSPGTAVVVSSSSPVQPGQKVQVEWSPGT